MRFLSRTYVSDFGSQTIVDTFRGLDEVISFLLICCPFQLRHLPLLTSRSCIKYGEKVTFPLFSFFFSVQQGERKNNFDFSQLPSSFEHVERSRCLLSCLEWSPFFAQGRKEGGGCCIPREDSGAGDGEEKYRRERTYSLRRALRSRLNTFSLHSIYLFSSEHE